MEGKDLRIVYMGTPEFAVAPLQKLVDNGYRVVAVITMPDKPAGRGLKIQYSAVKEYALSAGLPVLQPERLKDPDFLACLEALEPDLGIVVAFRMLPEAVWTMPRLGTFNLHASLLPQYRGAAPINWAIINGETETGVTTFFLNHRIDEGEILDFERVPIASEDTAGVLHDRLMGIGADLVIRTVDRIASGDYSTISQSHIDPTTLKSAPKIFRDDCRLDFSHHGREIVDRIRGLSPYPAAWIDMKPLSGTNVPPSTMKVYRATFEECLPMEECGSVVVDDRNGKLRVACTDGYVLLEEIQLSGKKRMGAAELLRGFRNIHAYRF